MQYQFNLRFQQKWEIIRDLETQKLGKNKELKLRFFILNKHITNRVFSRIEF